MANVIIPGRSLGKTRSEQARNLEKSGWGNAGLSREGMDKCKYLEKKYGKRFYRQTDIDGVK